MDSFAAPTWDVDKSANILCDKFSRKGKSSIRKNSNKKKPKVNFNGHQEDSKQKFTNSNLSPKFNIIGEKQQRKLGSKVRLKTKKGNISEQIVTKHKKRNQVNDAVTFSNEDTRKFVGKGQHFLKSNLSNDKRKGLKPNKPFPNENNRNNYRSSNLMHTTSSEKDYRNESKVNLNNKKPSSRKRNASHISESQNNIANFKKQKVAEDSWNQNKSPAVQKQTPKSTKFKNSSKKHKKNIQNENFQNNSNNEIESIDDNKNKINQSFNNKTYKNSKKEQNDKSPKLNSKIKETKEKEYQSMKAFKNPYSGKKKFLDSSVPLRERMLQQLKSSRFRYINEQLYTSDGKFAGELFKNDPDLFKVYHDGFKLQVDQWPVNPVDNIIKAIQRKPHLVVADFGCGDAKIAKSVKNKVHSFDLVALSNEVTVCDMAHTPLEDESVDICVFCLSLMGTNLGNYLIEANRVLRVGGTLKIAEVASRFESVESFVKAVKKYGFTLINKDLSNDLFYFLNFSKDSNIKKRKGLPVVSLNPCLYKKR